MIYYFSGTGNSLRAAQTLAGLLQTPALVAMTECGAAEYAIAAADTDKIFVFPVYAWAPPPVVAKFIDRLHAPSDARAGEVRAVFTCGDDTGLTARLLARQLARRGYSLTSAYAVRMRNTYVCLPGFDTDGAEAEREKEAAFPPRMERIAKALSAHAPYSQEETLPGPFAWTKSYVLRPLFACFLMNDLRFRATRPLCTRCGRCAKACPLHNVRPGSDGFPLWHGDCTHCLACYHACPRHAIEYGRFTRGKGQVAVTTF